MANQPIKGPDIYIGGKPKKKAKGKSWEAKELSDINKYWDRSPLKGRPMGITRESSRTIATHRISAKNNYRRRSAKGA